MDTRQVQRRIRTLIVDDAPEMLRTIAAMLAAVPDVEVVGEAGTAAKTLSIAAAKRPDLVLLDIRLHENGDSGLISELRTVLPKACIIALTVHEGAVFDIASSESGADGFLPKSNLHQELPLLIHRLFR